MTEEQKRAKEYEETLERFKSYQELKKKKNKSVVYDTTIKKYKKRKIKLVKKNPFLFILSKRHRFEEYKRNIEIYGYPLSSVPVKYRTPDICRLSVECNPNSFDIHDVPLRFITRDFCTFCVENGVNINKLPEKMIDLKLCKLSLEHKGSLSNVPIYMIDLDLCKYAIEINPNNVKHVPFGPNYVSEDNKKELYMLAWEHGLNFLEMPKEFITREMYEEKVRENPRNIFLFPRDMQDVKMWKLALESGLPYDLIPKKYTNLYNDIYEDNKKTYEEEIKKNPEYIFKIPEEKRDIKLWLLASENGLPLSKIPERYRKYYVSEDTLINSIRNNYHNIKKIPENRLSTELYVEAINGGMPFSDLPEKYRNKETCLAYANKNKKIDPRTPSELLDESFYDVLVRLDADNLSLVPFDAEKNVCLRTKEMCKEYVRQKHTINLKLFPLRYLKPEFIKSIFYDAANLSDILDGYIEGMHDYYKLKSLTSSEQVGKYKELLEKFYQKKLLDSSLRIPGATDEEMSKVENSESFKMIKDLNVDEIFCKNDEISKEDLIKIIMNAGKIINKESPRIKYVNNKSSDEDVRKIANAYKEMFYQISGKDIDKSKKDILMKDVRIAIDDLLNELDAHRRDVFNSELGNYKDDDHEHKKSL